MFPSARSLDYEFRPTSLDMLNNWREGNYISISWVMQIRGWLICIIHLKLFCPYTSPALVVGGMNCFLCISAENSSSPLPCITAPASLAQHAEPGLCHSFSFGTMCSICGCSSYSTNLLYVSPEPKISS